MNGLEALMGNTLLISAVTGWFVAQVLKTLIHAWVNKGFDLERLIGSGGMPSSHASTVCALAVSAGKEYGVGSPVFAVMLWVCVLKQESRQSCSTRFWIASKPWRERS